QRTLYYHQTKVSLVSIASCVGSHPKSGSVGSQRPRWRQMQSDDCPARPPSDTEHRSGEVARRARRSYARLCHATEARWSRSNFFLGHVSVRTTELYLGCKQQIRSAVNDSIGIEPNPSAGCAVVAGLPMTRALSDK